MSRPLRGPLCPCGAPACTYRPWSRLPYRERQALTRAAVSLYGPLCWLCLEPIAPGQLTLDHVVPDSRHGGHSLANLRPAHKSCNSARGARPRTSGSRIARPDWA